MTDNSIHHLNYAQCLLPSVTAIDLLQDHFFQEPRLVMVRRVCCTSTFNFNSGASTEKEELPWATILLYCTKIQYNT